MSGCSSRNSRPWSRARPIRQFRFHEMTRVMRSIHSSYVVRVAKSARLRIRVFQDCDDERNHFPFSFNLISFLRKGRSAAFRYSG